MGILWHDRIQQPGTSMQFLGVDINRCNQYKMDPHTVIIDIVGLPKYILNIYIRDTFLVYTHK